MKELLKTVAGMLVSEPSKIHVEEIDDGMMKKYVITVAKSDIKNIK